MTSFWHPPETVVGAARALGDIDAAIAALIEREWPKVRRPDPLDVYGPFTAPRPLTAAVRAGGSWHPLAIGLWHGQLVLDDDLPFLRAYGYLFATTCWVQTPSASSMLEELQAHLAFFDPLPHDLFDHLTVA